MIRIRLALVGVGSVLVWQGWVDYGASRSVSADPVPCDLAALEAGRSPPDEHVEFGRHLAAYGEAIYAYSGHAGDGDGDPPDDTRTSYVYYPILSPEHPLYRKLEVLTGPDATPEDFAEMPTLREHGFAVLVKTRRFATVGSIPDSIEPRAGLRGLVVNRLERLDPEDVRLVEEGFPTVDAARLVVVEEDRAPASARIPLAVMGVGILFVVAGLGLFAAPRLGRRSRARLRLLPGGTDGSTDG